MVARPCLNIVWSSASRTLIFLAVSGALSISYYSPSATDPVGQYSASPRYRVSVYPYSPECVEEEFSEVCAPEIATWHTKIVHMGDAPITSCLLRWWR